MYIKRDNVRIYKRIVLDLRDVIVQMVVGRLVGHMCPAIRFET